jgi:hypothetical protein
MTVASPVEDPDVEAFCQLLAEIAIRVLTTKGKIDTQERHAK